MSGSLFARLSSRYGPRVDAVTRREFLRSTLAASAGLLLSGRALSGDEPTSQPAKRRVAIVGAGFAGLACGYELRAAGYDVTILEARNRVGGRVLSFRDFVEGKNVEGGGELIGSNHPVWAAYAEKFGLQFLDVIEDDTLELPVILGGKRLDGRQAKALYDEMDDAFSLMNRDAEQVDADQPWNTPRAVELDRRTVGKWIDGLRVSDLARQGITAQLTADNGVSVHQQSYLGMLAAIKGGGLEKYWTESEVYRCRGGNQQLADRLAEAIGQDRLQLATAVEAIEIKHDRAALICAGNRSIEADDVVLTVPPSVWSKIRFTPPLSGLEIPQMGCNVKYLMAVENRFWKAAKLSPDGLTDGDVSLTWESTNNQPGDEGAGLCAFSGGPAAEACRRRDRAERDQAYEREMEALYPGFKARLKATRFMNWPSDPWTGASYSFPAPGQVTSVGPALHRGLGRLHFAGEHTCYKFVGYMEGGLHSGVAVAGRLAQRDGLPAH